ncbi:MAG: flavin-dependent oxidoreductase [Jhaorihella sp.]
MTVLIAGGGIAGLALGLTLQQIGVSFRIFETRRKISPLGVGINLQPNSVRELFDLDLKAQLDDIGVQTRQYGFYSRLGKTIWEEPRGHWAGYSWPQYSLHRGTFQTVLHAELLGRAGLASVRTGAHAVAFETGPDNAVLVLENGERVTGDLIVAADGIHSALRAQMHPDEGAPVWDGRMLWRATTRGPTFFGGGAMAVIGDDSQRFVAYPIDEPDAHGEATMNWIAEKRFPSGTGRMNVDWNSTADAGTILPLFEDWRFDWIDVPALIRGAGTIYEYPMVDRDPLPHWTDGRVTLMGDAAHPTYPVGSNGASQAIVDARVIGAKLLEHGLTPAAFQAYEAEIRPLATAVARANRAGDGPDGVLRRIADLCGGDFEDIEDIIPHAELAAHADTYKSIAGFSIEGLNARPRTIPAGARFGRGAS